MRNQNSSENSEHFRRNPSKTHRITVTIVLTLLALFGTAAVWTIAHAVSDNDGQSSHRHSSPGWGHRGGPAAMLSRHLNLSETQEEQVSSIFNAAHTEGDALRSEISELRQEIRESIRANGYQEDQVRIRIETHAPQMVDLMLLRIRTMAEVYELLTPEQKARIDEFMDKGPGFGRGRRFRRGFEEF